MAAEQRMVIMRKSNVVMTIMGRWFSCKKSTSWSKNDLLCFSPSMEVDFTDSLKEEMVGVGGQVCAPRVPLPTALQRVIQNDWGGISGEPG